MRIEVLLFIIITVLSSVLSVTYYLLNSYLSRRKITEVQASDGLGSQNATIIITVYNESVDHLRRAIRSVRNQVKEIIVVGDGATEPYMSLCEEENVSFLTTGVHAGKRKAMALGVSRVNTEIVIFMDGDMIPEPDAIKNVLQEYSPKVAGVGGNITFDTAGGNLTSYASQFIERSKEVIQSSMKHFGSVMLIDGGFGSYRMSVIKDYITSPEFYDFKINGEIPYYGGGDDADLTAYIIGKGYIATKSFEAKVTTLPKENIKAYMKQNIRWSRTGWRTFFKSLRNGTLRKANKFYRIEQIFTYTLPLVFLALIILKGTIFMEVFYHRGAIPAIINLIGYHLLGKINTYTILYRLSTTSSVIASLVFAGSVATRTVKDRLKTIAYGSIGAGLLFIATVYAMFTFRRA